MAPTARHAGRERARASRLVLAEAALVVVLLAALALSWPAGVPASPPQSPALALPSHPIALQGSRDGTAADDQAPPRNLPWRVALPTPPPLWAPGVASAPPVQLLIASQDLHPLVESVGVDRSGAMSAPRDYFDVGWYNLGPVPGDPGDAVIDGHAGYPDQPLVFGRLAKMRLGDKIVVVLADGSRRAFSVDSVKSWPFRAHPPGLFQGDGPARLTLITCSGDFNSKTYSYADRLVVEASYTGLD